MGGDHLEKEVNVVSATTLINPSELYQQAHEVATAVMADSPAVPYLLADIIDDDPLWEVIFSTAFLSVIPLHATLDGCAKTLKTRGITANAITALHNWAPTHTSISDTDMATARLWLATTLIDDLDHDGQQLMIVDHVLAKGWETHPARLTSLMLAVVATARCAASSTRCNLRDDSAADSACKSAA